MTGCVLLAFGVGCSHWPPCPSEMLPLTLAQAAAVTSIVDKPLVIVTAPVDAQPGWLEAQKAMLDLSSDSHQRVADGQSHASLILGEAGAAVCVQAISDVVASVRTAAPLPD